MRIDRQVIGAALAAFTVRAAAQSTPCVRVINGQVWYPSTSFTDARPNRPNTRVIVNGNVVADSVPFVARTGDGFLASGPGEAFGVTGYRCADCQMKRVPGQRPEDTFFAEPVVMSVTAATPVQAGDIIEAVNDRPITSSAGAEQFSYPPLGANTLTVRRGRDRLVLHFEVASCTPRNDTTIAFTLKGRDSIPPVRILPLKRLEGTTRIRVRGVVQMPDSLAQPIYVIDGVRMEPVSSSPATGYGFAFSCGYGCVKVTNPDGTRFYRFPAAPKITAIRDDSPAAKAGLKVGDVVMKIDGVSILDYEGASRLADTEHKSSLHVTVLREGKEIDFVLQPPK
jgi:S1-C subfamily serine protease